MATPQLDERLLLALQSPPLPKSAKELADELKTSQPTLSRALGRLGARLLTLGQARSTRYALAREVRDMGHRIPITRISHEGKAERLGELLALEGGRFFVQREDGKGQSFEDLPWFIWDMRPQGFLGRALVQGHPDLQLPGRWQDWSNDDILQWLARHGASCPGNLIVGEAAFQEWLEHEVRHREAAIAKSDRAVAYPTLADNALQGAGYGSSAGGEQPKFAAMKQDDSGRYIEVLVKFSPPVNTSAGRRWADLLICEHLALQLLAEAESNEAAHSEIIEAQGRVFLEVERFDRIGLTGRRGMVSLEAANAELLGLKEQTWEAGATALLAHRQISKTDHDALLRRAVFAQLIANNDRHFGNISFFWDDAGKLTLAPAYDMLPMAFAPVNNEVIERAFPVARPRTDNLTFWDWGKALAERYWQRAREDSRLSEEFRKVIANIPNP